jgi:hypothetical protein
VCNEEGDDEANPLLACDKVCVHRLSRRQSLIEGLV